MPMAETRVQSIDELVSRAVDVSDASERSEVCGGARRGWQKRVPQVCTMSFERSGGSTHAHASCQPACRVLILWYNVQSQR